MISNSKNTLKNLKKEQFMSKIKEGARNFFCHKREGIDGIIVVVVLCIIALAVGIVFQKQIGDFLTTIMTLLTNKATGILNP